MKLRDPILAMLIGISFLLVFEAVARFSEHFRSSTVLFPLSENGYENISILADDAGTRSSLYRGQKERWAVFGTSYSQGSGVSQNQVWTSELERLYQGKLHIRNHSNPGGFQLQWALLRHAALTNQKYDKVLISVAQSPLELIQHRSLRELLPNTGKFISANPNHPWQSGELLKQILSPSVKDLLTRWRSVRLGEFASAESIVENPTSIDLTKLGEYESCYISEMRRNQCTTNFLSAKPKSITLDEAWKLYESNFLPCQAKADKTCGIGRRSEKIHPYFVGHHAQYRHQLDLLVREARKLSDNIYLISRALGTNFQSLPHTLVTDYGSGLYVVNDTFNPVVLTTKAAAETEEMRNQESLKAIAGILAQQPDIKFLDFDAWFKLQLKNPHGADSRIANSPALFFGDFAHLSPDGNRLFAEYIFQQMRATE